MKGLRARSPLSRRSLGFNEPLQNASVCRVFPGETHQETRELSAHLDGSQVAGSALMGKSTGQMNRPKMRGGLARFWEGAIPQSRDRPSRVGEGAACEKPALRAIVLSKRTAPKCAGVSRVSWGRPTEKRASIARIGMSASSPVVRHWESRWAQMNRPKMRVGLARFWEGAILQSKESPSRVGERVACEKPALEAIVLSE